MLTDKINLYNHFHSNLIATNHTALIVTISLYCEYKTILNLSSLSKYYNEIFSKKKIKQMAMQSKIKQNHKISGNNSHFEIDVNLYDHADYLLTTNYPLPFKTPICKSFVNHFRQYDFPKKFKNKRYIRFYRHHLYDYYVDKKFMILVRRKKTKMVPLESAYKLITEINQFDPNQSMDMGLCKIYKSCK